MIRIRDSLKKRIRYFYYALNNGAIRNIILREKPDVVHLHRGGYSDTAVLSICRQLNIPVVVSYHGIIGMSDSVKINKWEKSLEKKELHYCEINKIPVTVIASGIKDRFIKVYGLTGDNIHVVLNGTHMKKKESPESIFKRYDLPSNAKIVTVIGNVSVRKNQTQVVRAYRLLPKGLQNCTYIFFMGGDSENILENEIIEEEKGHLIRCGFISPDILPLYLQNASLNILASIDEGFGISLIEGFVYGIPSLCFSDIDAVPDLKKENVLITVNERTDRALADAIALTLSKSFDRVEIMKHAQNFSIENTASQYIAIYRKIAK